MHSDSVQASKLKLFAKIVVDLIFLKNTPSSILGIGQGLEYVSGNFENGTLAIKQEVVNEYLKISNFFLIV